MWYFHHPCHLAFLPLAFLSSDIFIGWHFYHWYFYHLTFLPLTFLRSGIYHWHFYILAFLAMVFLPMAILPMLWHFYQWHFTAHCQGCRSIRDAPFDIWGGGVEFLLLANFFFTSERKQSFFGDQRSTIFLLCFVEEIFLSYAFPIMYVTIWCFFLVNILFINFDSKLFFCPHFQQTFFSDFCGDKLFFQFFSSPPMHVWDQLQAVKSIILIVYN